MTTNKKKCKICQKIDKLVKSHIVPRSFFDLTQGHLIAIDSKIPFRKRSQIGPYDAFICETCEQKFNELDRYGNKIFKPKKEKIDKLDGEDINLEYISTQEEKVDMNKFQRFFLSILFRAHLCEHDGFKEVNLGTKYLDTIKRILFDGEEVPPNIFSILISKNTDPSTQSLWLKC